MTDGWIFLKFSGYGHKWQLPRLFHVWIDSFTLLKLDAVEVCAFGVLLVTYKMYCSYTKWVGISKNYHLPYISSKLCGINFEYFQSNFSWYNEQLPRLFHVWIDCFTLLKIGAVEVCAFGVLLVTYKMYCSYTKWVGISKNYHLPYISSKLCGINFEYSQSNFS